MHVNIVLADDSLQYTDILAVADLHEKVTATALDIPGQQRISVLRYPDDVSTELSHAMSGLLVFAHNPKIHFYKL